MTDTTKPAQWGAVKSVRHLPIMDKNRDQFPPAMASAAMMQGANALSAIAKELDALRERHEKLVESGAELVADCESWKRENAALRAEVAKLRGWMNDAEQRAKAAEEVIASLREKNGKRPCDCSGCDCRNSGDTEAVGFWDGANWVLNELDAARRKDAA